MAKGALRVSECIRHLVTRTRCPTCRATYRVEDAAECRQLGLHGVLLALELGEGEVLRVAIRLAGRRGPGGHGGRMYVVHS